MSITTIAKTYLKVRSQLDEAQRKYNEFIFNELNKWVNQTPTKKEFVAISKLYSNVKKYNVSDNVSSWLEKWGIEFAKSTKYKGYEIKFYNGRYISFKNGKRELINEKLDTLKSMLDERIEADKKMPAIMAKLGLEKLQYETHACKRSTVYDKTIHKFSEEMTYNLYNFWKKHQNIKEWKIEIIHDTCSHTREELAYECRSECEYSYCVGDYVSIHADRRILDWGACLE